MRSGARLSMRLGERLDERERCKLMFLAFLKRNIFIKRNIYNCISVSFFVKLGLVALFQFLFSTVIY